MPVKTWDLKADFDGAYRINVRDASGKQTGEKANYERRVLYSAFESQAANLVARFAWPLNSSIAIVGCGFGWSVEALQALGYPNVWGADTSLYIQAVKAQIDPADGIARSLVPDRVRDDDLMGNPGRNRFIRETIGQGGQFDVVILENLVTSLSDIEVGNATGVINQIARVAASLIIIDVPTAPASDPDYNWHTVAEWDALIAGTDWIFVTAGAR